MARPICFKLLVHCARRAASRADWTAGSNREIRTAMIAITTRSSMSVKPLCPADLDMEPSLSCYVMKSLRSGWDRQRRVGSASSFAHGQVIEIRLCVRLGPQADHPRLGEGRVLDLQVLLVIEVASDLRHHHRHPQGVPLVVAGNLRRLELGAFSVLDLVHAEVVLQQVVSS